MLDLALGLVGRTPLGLALCKHSDAWRTWLTEQQRLDDSYSETFFISDANDDCSCGGNWSVSRDQTPHSEAETATSFTFCTAIASIATEITENAVH